MKIYVIGNGFDIAHGLKTSYKDYLLFIKERANKENGWEIILDYYPSNYEFWSDAETNICNINWDRFLKTKVFPNYCDLDILLKKIKESFTQFIFKQTAFISNMDPKFDLDRNALYLNFNYTSVLENIYKIPRNQIIYIHNTVNEAAAKFIFGIDADEIILGHGPDSKHYIRLPDSTTGKDKYYISFINATLKNTTSIIKKVCLKEKLSTINKYVEEVVFYGFSFSPNDKEYVQTISNCLLLPKTKFKLYYYVKNDELEENVIKRFKENIANCSFDINKINLFNCKGILKF